MGEYLSCFITEFNPNTMTHTFDCKIQDLKTDKQQRRINYDVPTMYYGSFDAFQVDPLGPTFQCQNV